MQSITRLSMKSISIRKDYEVKVDCRLPLRSYATNTTCALQGRRGACQLLPSPSELRHKYNVRSIPIRKDDEVQVDCYLLLRSCAANTKSCLE